MTFTPAIGAAPAAKVRNRLLPGRPRERPASIAAAPGRVLPDPHRLSLPHSARDQSDRTKTVSPRQSGDKLEAC